MVVCRKNSGILHLFPIQPTYEQLNGQDGNHLKGEAIALEEDVYICFASHFNASLLIWKPLETPYHRSIN